MYTSGVLELENLASITSAELVQNATLLRLKEATFAQMNSEFLGQLDAMAMERQMDNLKTALTLKLFRWPSRFRVKVQKDQVAEDQPRHLLKVFSCCKLHSFLQF